MWHFILHLLGIDTQQSYFYDFWSGIATQLGLLIGITSWYWHHTCHVQTCWRRAKFPVKGTPYTVCAKHHPETPDKVTHLHIVKAHKEANQ